jgi:tetratricopeptide (TPR) repeat protein
LLIILIEPAALGRLHSSSSNHRTKSTKTSADTTSKHKTINRHHSKKGKFSHRAAAAPKLEQPDSLAQSKGNYEGLEKAYSLYDRGLNERFSGNNGEAISDLSEAQHEFHRVGNASELEAFASYDLGQAAEAKGDFTLAKESYGKAVYIQPNFIQASRALTRVLATSGHQVEALVKAREQSQSNPSDPIAHMMLGVILDKNGFSADANIEKEKAKQLLKPEQ